MNSEKSSEWHGIVKLVYDKIADKTQVSEAYSQSPFKIQRPFYGVGEEVCQSVILHTAGGIVGGDRLTQNIHLKPGAKTNITTVSASKVYRSTGQTSQQTVEIRLDESAYLEYLPRETIIFNGANYRQDLRIELAPSACWLGWEITRFGRTARGEKFEQGKWRSCTEVYQNGHPLWIDRQGFIADEAVLNCPHGLAGQPLIGTLSWVGQPVSEEILEKVRYLWQKRETQGEAGVTRLMSGLLCRYRGSSTQEVINWFTDVWQVLRQSYGGKPVTKPRVWL